MTKKNSDITVVVGMSGGVDSSVSLLLLKEQGYKVIGLFMKNWEEKTKEGICSSLTDFEDVARVCTQLNVPYYSCNFSQEYKDEVFASFLKDYKQGFTPNPDILCNKEIKFKLLLDAAQDLGADFLATGHYAQNPILDQKHHLAKGFDLSKDQSYFIYTLNNAILSKVLFPVGHLLKSDVRKIAKHHSLSTAEKKDSTGICFIGERNFKDFLGSYIGFTPGNIETLDGKIIGKHQGAAFFTIGQRKGLAIGGEGDAWFVVQKNMQKNTVIVAQGKHHPALYADDLIASELSWVTESPKSFPFSCKAKIRYRQEDQSCKIEKIEGNRAFVTFEKPQRAITIKQSIVFYDKNLCLGGGVIEKAGPSYFEQNRSVSPTT
jgi:tRNA-specific 2-thiouridylase